jgi:STE24 endopeptidase
MGPRKNIVLYDTLIEDHTTEELVAVLAHEVGHYKKKHVQKGLIISILNTGVMLYLMGWLINTPELSQALGASDTSFHIGLFAFSLLFSPISMVTGLAMNLFSRKNEYEADSFAKSTYNGQALVDALKKLSVKHLSNLNPHPLYVFFYYSHPPLLSRISNINKS